jgi:hypothetical protein
MAESEERNTACSQFHGTRSIRRFSLALSDCKCLQFGNDWTPCTPCKHAPAGTSGPARPILEPWLDMRSGADILSEPSSFGAQKQSRKLKTAATALVPGAGSQLGSCRPQPPTSSRTAADVREVHGASQRHQAVQLHPELISWLPEAVILSLMTQPDAADFGKLPVAGYVNHTMVHNLCFS